MKITNYKPARRSHPPVPVRTGSGGLKINRGFTLLEMVISIAIFGAISVVIWGFGRNIFFFNSDLNSSLSLQFDARQVLRKVVAELRSTSPSSLGAYAISSASTSTITFFSDIDDDFLKEQVRYFMQGKELRRGVVKPSGSPLTYNQSNETISIVARDIINGTSTPIFYYYNNTYTGTSSPLTLPVLPLLLPSPPKSCSAI